MRAGLLSHPTVVALLQSAFVPCMISARHTAACMADPRDAALLASYEPADGPEFVGGERELFVLPDGTRLDVFASLHGGGNRTQLHMTAAGRRLEAAAATWRRHAEAALRAAHGALPDDWSSWWDGTAPAVARVAGASPRWPEPPPGTQALRVFVRNSDCGYDDLHGAELVPLAEATVAALAAGMHERGAAATLPRTAFVDLVRAMVPRGAVGTRLAAESIDGELVLHADRVDRSVIEGRVSGRFAMRPNDKAEVSRRSNAASLFTSAGRLVGRFTLDAASGRFRELRCVATDVALERFTPFRHPDWFPPAHAIAFEWVGGQTPAAGAAR